MCIIAGGRLSQQYLTLFSITSSSLSRRAGRSTSLPLATVGMARAEPNKERRMKGAPRKSMLDVFRFFVRWGSRE